MGPIALFDKSFLQSLNLDEAVWFDQFYEPNIPPLFYVETLADLDKEISRGRTAEQVVGEIASKTPELSGAPNVHHLDLLLANLMGQHISMDKRPIVAGGRFVESGGKKGVNLDVSPEAKAFARWQNREYLQIEREFASNWRARLKLMTFESSATYTKELGIDIQQCKNIDDAYAVANQIVSERRKPYELIEFIISAFEISREYHQELVPRYQNANFPSLIDYAPYAAYVTKVEIFFHISVLRSFISADRPSNKVDVAYLYYLPFCNVFISGDKLHKNITPLFLGKGQQFIWGPDLKADLTKLNEHFMALPEDIRDKGIISFANRPPIEGDFLTASLWDMISSTWRTGIKNIVPLNDQINDELVKHIKGFTEAPTLPFEKTPIAEAQTDSMCIQRSISKKRGSWYQLPKNFKNSV
ncbi:MAG: hypothetical protein ABL903_17950 [Methylococcales bacterium]